MRKTGRSSGARRSAIVASGRPAPQRTCVACRAVRPKRALVRIVRSPSGGLVVDPRGKLAGRGAYCDPDAACLERGLREGAIARALEVAIDTDTAARLGREMAEVAESKKGLSDERLIREERIHQPERVSPPKAED